MKKTCCDICGSCEFEAELGIDDYVSLESFELIRCKNCGLMFVKPSLYVGTMEKYYTNGLYNRSGFNTLGFWLRKRKLDKYLGRSRPGRVLDIGCGDGKEIEYLKTRGWQVVGTELSEDSCAAAKSQGLDVYCESLHGLNFPSEYFDVVMMWHVIEHLPSPRQTLEEVYRILKTNGKLLLACPNYHSVDVWLAKERALLETPRHLYQFTENTLMQLLDDIGYVVETLHHFSLEIGVVATTQSLLNILPITGAFPNFLLDWLGSSIYRNRMGKAKYRLCLVSNLIAILPVGFISLVFHGFSSLTGYSNSIELGAFKK